MKEHLESLFAAAVTDAHKIAKLAAIKILSTKSMSTLLNEEDVAELGLTWSEIAKASISLTGEKIAVTKVVNNTRKEYQIFKRIKVFNQEKFVSFELDMQFYDLLFRSYTTKLKTSL